MNPQTIYVISLWVLVLTLFFLIPWYASIVLFLYTIVLVSYTRFALKTGWLR